MPESKRPLKVFLCHASQDKPVVRELSRRLVGEGWIDTWVDEKKLLPGQDWRTEIEEAVETSDIVIICLSTNSVTKEGFVQKELRYAREIAFEKPEETIFLVPLRLDDCSVPRGLRFYQWGDYFGEKKNETYDALLKSLKLRYEQKLRIEEEERAHKEQERQEREASEKAAHEKEQDDLNIQDLRQNFRASFAPISNSIYTPKYLLQTVFGILYFAFTIIAVMVWPYYAAAIIIFSVFLFLAYLAVKAKII
ncbi:MAG: toll/interleukin-1 receptor domain-containing protein [Anaerolineales bacterium]